MNRERYLENLQDEVDGAYLYRVLADLEDDPALAELYRRLAETEERHAEFWKERLEGETVDGPSRRARVLAWLGRRVARRLLLSVVASDEERGQFMYDDQPETESTSMRQDERSHARLLRSISGGMEGTDIARFEGRHRAVGGNALRAAVLGSNDGLVSNLALVMGVAGAALSAQTVLISGLAGLLAGSASMALGEWLSVQSARELHQRQLDIERREIQEMPEEEEEELILIYRAKGFEEEEARKLASRIMQDPERALDTLAREELGIDPDELGGSAWEAALTSFLLFALGAIIPVVPFFFVSGLAAVAWSMGVSGLGLFGIGAGITLVTGRSLWRSGLRQMALGLTAAALTYGIGALLGVTVSG
ncbi:MAG: VIT1/CCC1 transporter family protein [bacterium]